MLGRGDGGRGRVDSVMVLGVVGCRRGVLFCFVKLKIIVCELILFVYFIFNSIVL